MKQKTKILREIKSTETGNKKIINQPYYTISYSEFPREIMLEYAMEYDIGVSLGSTMYVSMEEIKSNPEVVEYNRKKICRMVAEELYGDVRKELIDLSILVSKENIPYDSQIYQKIKNIIEMITYD